MSYYNILNLEREPFSTSPYPEFFYHSNSHHTALRRLEIAIRLRRGLSLVIGDVGTGKTTLSRALIQGFKDEDDFLFHVILDPGYKSGFQFLHSLIKAFGLSPAANSELDFKEAIKNYLFSKGVEENKTVVLIIDEGQKITPNNLEALRMLLNYETNEYKLLQLVILAQVELLPRISYMRNFTDRISLKYTINPLDENETSEMINFRLRQAGYNKQDSLFTQEAVKLIYKYTQGYPRKITLLCHDALEELVMRERAFVDALLIDEIANSRQAYSIPPNK